MAGLEPVDITALTRTSIPLEAVNRFNGGTVWSTWGQFHLAPCDCHSLYWSDRDVFYVRDGEFYACPLWGTE
ncbi:hypothetical protein A8924_7403 [Saccharopolyspora erythraea NRRL 2338]|uniref:Uncharacterized protein n=2 Tax=Saccharopolyspora erythraea TaxID=1836 RepID=A4FQ48_SACEN|nr:hypothetical protein [Saccharopolyspora erythraea]EQD84395.1 hypothetical protein N599_20305 [Saccharopolyspora erythraea D]PFG99819.1 hypothetical protein A8924_7374 [Saccharopolyspora erythraea NRRL 2338]PFG99846.1 hypothetical protein A8924_7403 [Saccharopolyspora erythraea NRRL 2338]QRK89690.1 hypothetical protein JQX30_35105 [Saccharopolyspora erythraea]CAM06173.1 hypothetical protein SACE_7012 [Saccharopolyspora erythraea NRRL 2338]